MGTELVRHDGAGLPPAVAMAMPPPMSRVQILQMSQEEVLALIDRLQARTQVVRLDESGRAVTAVRHRLRMILDRDVNRIDGKVSISATGWSQINAVASINFRTPDEVVVDGKARANPFVERDPRTQLVRCVHHRLIGVGRTRTGNLQAMDYTVVYDLATYLIGDLYAKARKGPASGVEIGVSRIGEVREDQRVFVVQHALGDGTAVGMICDLSKQDARDAFKTHAERMKFAVRNAATVCQRNLLKKMTGVQLELGADDYFYAEVTGWVDADGTALGRAIRGDGPEEIIEAELCPVETVHEHADPDSDHDSDLGSVDSSPGEVLRDQAGARAGRQDDQTTERQGHSPVPSPARAPAAAQSAPAPGDQPISAGPGRGPSGAASTAHAPSAPPANNRPDTPTSNGAPDEGAPSSSQTTPPARPPAGSLSPSPSSPQREAAGSGAPSASRPSGGGVTNPVIPRTAAPPEGSAPSALDRRRALQQRLKQALNATSLTPDDLERIYKQLGHSRESIRAADVETWERLLALMAGAEDAKRNQAAPEDHDQRRVETAPGGVDANERGAA